MARIGSFVHVLRSRIARRVLALAVGWVLGLLFCVPGPAAADDWVIQCVDCPKQFSVMTDRSLQLDAAGHPHIAYGGDHLYYAWHGGAEWHYETVDGAYGVRAGTPPWPWMRMVGPTSATATTA